MRLFLVFLILLAFGCCGVLSQCALYASKRTDDGPCICDEGYTGEPAACTDIDECQLQGVCSGKGTCANLDGSFHCTCQEGYTGHGQICLDLNECAYGHDCDDETHVCTNTEGSYKCDCAPGYWGNGTKCFDVNECTGDHTPNNAISECHADATCVNTNGSYSCVCNPGFRKSGNACIDDTLCSSNPCGENSVCVDTVSVYKCSCQDGFSGDGFTCVDVDECVDGLICRFNETCQNTNGSYICAENPFYKGLSSSALITFYEIRMLFWLILLSMIALTSID